MFVCVCAYRARERKRHERFLYFVLFLLTYSVFFNPQIAFHLDNAVITVIILLSLNKSFIYLQDGKTLPNGPVVISPDGLFPSLFREGEALLK